MALDAPHRGLLGDPGRPAGIALPPDALPLVLGGRVRKRWRYVGAYGPGLSVCVGLVHIGLLTQSFWAVWDRSEGRLRERTRPRRGGVRLTPGEVRVRDGEVSIDLRLGEDAVDAVETVTPYGPAHAWTLKRAGVPVEGVVRIRERELTFDGLGVVDDSAGFPPRHTSWRWSAGVGTDKRGRAVGWNLVDGIHDDPAASERSVWVDGRAVHTGPVRFADDLSGVRSTDATDDAAPAPGSGAPGAEGRVDLAFRGESTRARRDNLLVIRSSYEQPFGSFSGVLPGGVELVDAHGVMERHDAVW
ncbi:DUF2804 domain-containing protein [Patulibacter minatonensis]|uniref:DUF2804 family protein n=1 Tax=Patulibacter minatonensis TaxID=298163 RepID=UPI00047D32C7|nr:DUF2804 family protein [Patulibacter minatonensis]